MTVVTVVAVVVFWFSVIVVGVCFFKGVLFFLPPFVTWVQPSSSLSGWSPVSSLGLPLVNGIVFGDSEVAAAAAILVVVVVVVVVGVVILVVF